MPFDIKFRAAPLFHALSAHYRHRQHTKKPTNEDNEAAVPIVHNKFRSQLALGNADNKLGGKKKMPKAGNMRND
ncbi:hypothetical protein niasHT_036055 [Heterodera trifolii]|uniref:Uncharacterized protein n=1 Tax=Heterodera trifolii TaxID=157864 RepID=A0ABD2IH80_9BILA